MGLHEYQRRVDEWINQFEEGYWHPLSMLTSLVEEVGELSKESMTYMAKNQKRGAKKRRVGKRDGGHTFLINLYGKRHGYRPR